MLLSNHSQGVLTSINSELIMQVLAQTVHVDSLSGASTVPFTFERLFLVVFLMFLQILTAQYIVILCEGLSRSLISIVF
jgi:hypothetical protein